MFVQIIQGRTSDAEALHQRIEDWQKELMPGAIGFLGSTGGVTKDGDVILVARFESKAAAERNAGRPEQDAWWRGTEKLIDGAVFHDSEDTETFLAGGSDTAGFVQVMQGRAKNRAAVAQREKEVTELLPTLRPDLIGSVRAWYDGNAFTEVAYFTSEAEARVNEAKEMPAELKAGFDEWMSNIEDMRYIDLQSPWFSTP